MNIFESRELIDQHFPEATALDLATGDNTGKAGTAVRMNERVKEITLTPAEEAKYFLGIHGKDLYHTPNAVPSIDAETLFGTSGSLSFDIGSGRGERLVSLAETNPDRMFVGIESHHRSALLAARAAADAGLDNIRFVRADAKLLLQKVPDGSSDETAILFPAPQHDRRGVFTDIIQEPLAADIARILAPEAPFEFATDSEPYFNVKMRMLGDIGLFSCDIKDISHQVERGRGDDTPIRTRYQEIWESKGIPTHRATMRPL